MQVLYMFNDRFHRINVARWLWNHALDQKVVGSIPDVADHEATVPCF